MGEQRNLTEENVGELRAHLERMAKENPELEYRFFKQDDAKETQQPSNKEIFEKLEAIEQQIKRIFDR